MDAWVAVFLGLMAGLGILGVAWCLGPLLPAAQHRTLPRPPGSDAMARHKDGLSTRLIQAEGLFLEAAGFLPPAPAATANPSSASTNAITSAANAGAGVTSADGRWLSCPACNGSGSVYVEGLGNEEPAGCVDVGLADGPASRDGLGGHGRPGGGDEGPGLSEGVGRTGQGDGSADRGRGESVPGGRDTAPAPGLGADRPRRLTAPKPGCARCRGMSFLRTEQCPFCGRKG